MQIIKSVNLFIFISKYVEDFTLKYLLSFEICAREVCKILFTKFQKQQNMLKIIEPTFLRNLQTSRENNSRILRNFQGIDFI